ncbi:hypothetical protein FE840_018700 (plasmid) [Peteryoungia desertarenae]|uniref:Uncharacterized protein n=1 Tax=Peteryoungia desertarenae TaxID=1813451 RepID=A0ABX6QTM9_9HYPH|nr:hypothetical protein [Peteryoungia desertarenae]QLF71677.1 hypothetical protein FE840_018700 [Peteryoungia desertarenae]
MTNTVSGANSAPTHSHAVNPDVLHPRLHELCHQVLTSSFGSTALMHALASGLSDVSSQLRGLPATEGRLIERGIQLIAGLNPELVVLTENIRLPVSKAALDVVERNDPRHYASLTLDADSGGRRGYTPDLIIVNRGTKVAHVVDVKRSLSSYDAVRLQELKKRMLAGALTVPDLLYQEHHRLSVEAVQVVILDAQNASRDASSGIWPVSDLDHLLEVEGAGKAIAYLRRSFQTAVEQVWREALQHYHQARELSSDERRAGAMPWADTQRHAPDKSRASDRDDRIVGAAGAGERPEIRIGFATLPTVRAQALS